MSNSQQGKLIVICGIDGSGKTTQEKYIDNYFSERKLRFKITKQPTDWYRQNPLVRTFLDSGELKCSQETLGLLAATDRMLHIETEIQPLLMDGVNVISNRYVYSTYAYFKARGADMDFIRYINSKVREPDLGILMKIDPHEGLKRLAKRDGNRSKFEERDAGYLCQIQDELVNNWPKNFLTVDAMDTEENISKKIIFYLNYNF